ncbi:MAG: tyrosine recombinase [Alphaproteobacteria bacterium]|jgi:integrase/recombinase XerD|nr:tyrosine recombinase [Alphaproteobacteria bacterium]
MNKLNPKDTSQLNLFLDSLKIEKGLSANTIASYTHDITDFALFLSKRKPQRNLDTAGTEDIQDYLQSLTRKSFTAKTQSRRISAIKQLYSFLHSEKIINSNISQSIKNPKLNKSLPKFLSEDEVLKMLEVSVKDKNPLLYTMLEVLYSTGVRVSELVSLRLSSLLEGGMFLLVKGKGDKERVIPLVDIATRAIENWLNVRDSYIKLTPKNSLYLFPSNKSASGHISRERFAQVLKELAIKCNIAAEKVSPHVLRHSFASHLLNNGGDLKSIQNMLGHSDIATTEIYTHMLDSKLKEAVYKNHPLNYYKKDKK